MGQLRWVMVIVIDRGQWIMVICPLCLVNDDIKYSRCPSDSMRLVTSWEHNGLALSRGASLRPAETAM